MAKPVMLSDENYSRLFKMRRKKGEKSYESFNDVITRILTEGPPHA